ncbi:MAG TPA: MFS transporter [Gemmatimonadales bacterium]|nr:MFS transporter [Gemmatimonadales bacterium]
MIAASLLIFITVFVDLIGFGIVLPLLPSYAAAFHAGDAAIGLLVASFSFMQFLLAHWWGRLSDRVGRRPVLLVGLLGSSLSYLLFGLATSFWVLLLSRVLAGGMGANVNVAQAYLADVTPPERRARAMGLIGAAFGLGFVVGPALGGIASRFGNGAPGFLAAALSGLNLLLALRWLPETRAHVAQTVERVRVHWSRFLMAFAAVACSTGAFTVLYVVFPLQVERALGLDRHHSAFFFVLMGVVSAVIQGGLVGRLVPRVGERALLVTGPLLLALGLGLLPVAFEAGPHRGLAMLYVALLVLSAGWGFISPSAAAFVSRVAPADEQGRALGLLQSTGAVARIVGPVMAGTVAAHAGADAAFVVASGAALLAGLSALFYPVWGGWISLSGAA